MSNRRKIEIFSAGCPVCQDAIAIITANACPYKAKVVKREPVD